MLGVTSDGLASEAVLVTTAGLTKKYPAVVALDSLTIDIAPGIIGLVGPNGAGKTTLLRAISGLVQWERQTRRGMGGEIALEGSIEFDGERINDLPAHEIRSRGLLHCPERRHPAMRFSYTVSSRNGWRLSLSQQARNRAKFGARLCAVSPAERAAQPSVRHALRRRTADAGDGAGADVQAAAPVH